MPVAQDTGQSNNKTNPTPGQGNPQGGGSGPSKEQQQPAGPNPIDINRTGLIGKPLDRVDGPLKVTGQAPYAYEYIPDSGQAAYGFIVNSAVSKGRIADIDTTAAQKVPGVLLVMTHHNAPKQTPYGPPHPEGQALERAKPFLDTADVRHYAEAIALVVADSFETARHAASLVKVRYTGTAKPATRVADHISAAYKPQGHPDVDIGDFDAAYAASPVKLDETYTTPYQSHNAMELHATLAEWQGDRVTLHVAHQLPNSAQETVAKTFQIPKAHVRIVSRYVGGGFGGKLPTEADCILAALAARQVGRPVKVAMTRQQTFFNVYHRTESVQRIRLGAQTDGTLTSIAHECWLQTATFDEYVESAGNCTGSLYAAPVRGIRHRLVKLDLPPTGSMRAPGEAIGMLCIEQAMDELAIKLDMDPVALRLKNDTPDDPAKQKPFSSRNLAQCLKEGAARFGWDKRPKSPGAMREGRWLIGYGMASAYRGNILQPSEAEVTVDKAGKVTCRLAMTDIGTGSYTILSQIAAETLQVPMSDVIVLIGDTSFPETPGSGGSFGANSAGSGLFNACMNLRKALASAAVDGTGAPLSGGNPDHAEFHDGKVVIDGKTDGYGAIAGRTTTGSISAHGEIGKLDTYEKFAQAAFGAHFAEVAVDADTGEVRMRRMLGVFAAGRILNEKTALSQATGGMIWGLSSALHEEAMIDDRYGNFVNHDLAEYHVPVNADIGKVEAVYLPEVDDKTGPLKIKGVGELGISGAGAAIANAVYNATGVRIRDYPITLDKVLKGMPV